MDENKYNLNMDIKYDYLEVIKVPEIIENCKEKWFNQTLCKVNSSVLRLGIFEGEFHMHKHDNDDEVFYVLDGELLIESENGNFKLATNEGIRPEKESYADLNKLTQNFILDADDIISTSSWGIYNNENVLIDYGCTTYLGDIFYTLRYGFH